MMTLVDFNLFHGKVKYWKMVGHKVSWKGWKVGLKTQMSSQVYDSVPRSLIFMVISIFASESSR